MKEVFAMQISAHIIIDTKPSLIYQYLVLQELTPLHSNENAGCRASSGQSLRLSG